jgi:hypothetical protein
MHSIDYVTVFDVSTAGFKNWWFPCAGLLFVAVGFLLPALMKSGFFRRTSPSMERWFPRVFLWLAILWTSIASFVTGSDYRHAVAAMRTHQTSVVEGAVTQFTAMPPSGHAMESFVVNGVKFELSDYSITAGFNHSSSHGGPVRPGMRVRIWHLNGAILRLDIKKEASQSSQPTPRRG